MRRESRAIRAVVLASLALGALRCASSDDEPNTGTDTGGTGGTSSGTGGSAGPMGGSGFAGGNLGGTGGSGGADGAGAPGTGGASNTGGVSGLGGVSGTGGSTAGTTNGGAGSGGAGASGAAGSAATAGSGTAGAAGAGALGGAGGASGGSGGNVGSGGKGGSGGAPNCASRTGGALIDFRACNQTMRFWITSTAFITEAIRLRGNGQSSIACFRPQEGRDCDAALTYHAAPDTPYWTDFELETYFTCPQDVEGNKSFWLEQVGQFCGQMTTVTAVDDNR